MRIIVLNEAMEPIGVIGIVNTLIWVRRYYKCGSFELYFPAKYYDLVRKGSGKYIYRTDRNELGVIRERNFTESDTGKKTAYAKGYFSETLLENRVINSTYNKSGLLEDISRDIVDKYCISSGADRRIPNLSLGARHGISTDVYFNDVPVGAFTSPRNVSHVLVGCFVLVVDRIPDVTEAV